MTQPRIGLARLTDDYKTALASCLSWIDLPNRLRGGGRVFVKPNLTFPVYRPGVMTTPACVEALLSALKDCGGRIVIGESDSGGYNPFNIDEVMQRIGLVELAKKYGATLVNLSRMPARELTVRRGWRTVRFPFPAVLLDETDLVISAAVPKIHMNTGVSLTVKNLWGCIPHPSVRLRLHPHLGPVLHHIVESLPATVGIVDGRVGLNRSGPMSGDSVALGWLMAADDLYAADAMGCRLMQIDPTRVPHLRRAGVARLQEVRTSAGDWQPFLRDRFYLKRTWTDIPGYLAFHSSMLTYIGYFSPVAGPLHRLLYLFRKPFYDYENPQRTAS